MIPIMAIGIWSQRHLWYLKKHHRTVYAELLASDKLNDYLADLNEQAEEMFFRLVKELAEKGRYHGKAQSGKSDALGTADEQRPSNGSGNRQSRIYLCIRKAEGFQFEILPLFSYSVVFSLSAVNCGSYKSAAADCKEHHPQQHITVISGLRSSRISR